MANAPEPGEAIHDGGGRVVGWRYTRTDGKCQVRRHHRRARSPHPRGEAGRERAQLLPLPSTGAAGRPVDRDGIVVLKHSAAGWSEVDLTTAPLIDRARSALVARAWGA